MLDTLPIELQLDILELALPPPTPRRLPERRARLKTLSLVHRDWTVWAQRELFKRIRIDFDRHADPSWRMQGVLGLVTRMGIAEVDVEVKLSRLEERRKADELALRKAVQWCTTITTLKVVWSEGAPPALAGPLLSDVDNLVVAFLPGRQGRFYTPPPYLFPTLPNNLTRLVLLQINAKGVLGFPPLPHLRTFLMGGIIGLRCPPSLAATSPLLINFAWKSPEHQPHFLASIPSSVSRLRLVPHHSLFSSDKLPTFQRALPNLRTLEVSNEYMPSWDKRNFAKISQHLTAWCDNQGIKLKLCEPAEGDGDFETWAP
ncbi:hypothetical protein JCM10213_008403 [Rhodosporidiobolus nylandii]